MTALAIAMILEFQFAGWPQILTKKKNHVGWIRQLIMNNNLFKKKIIYDSKYTHSTKRQFKYVEGTIWNLGVKSEKYLRSKFIVVIYINKP